MQEARSATTSSNTTIKCPSDLLFLYRHVIGREVGDLGKVIRARKPTRLPVVMTRDEVKAVLSNLSEDKFFITILRNIKEVNEIMRFLYPKYRCNRLAAQHAGGGYNDQSNYCWA